MECITCNEVNTYGRPCLLNEAQFSSNGTYYIWTCRGTYTLPMVKIMETKNSKPLLTWEDNAQLQKEFQTKALPQQKDLWVDVGGGFEAQVRLILPHDFNKAKKYPLLIYT